MKRNMTLVGTVLLLSWTAAAQDNTPRQEMYLGYDMLRANSARSIPGFTANGGGGQYVFNFNSWFGGVADIYAVHNGNVFGGVTLNGVDYPGGKIDNTHLFYQFGPRIAIRHWGRVTPFFEMFLGGQKAAASVPVKLPPGSSVQVAVPGGIYVICTSCAEPQSTAVSLRLKSGQSAFAYKLGGGLDLKLTKNLSLRPIEADEQFTRLSQPVQPYTTRSQYNFVYSTGFNFTFGGAQ